MSTTYSEASDDQEPLLITVKFENETFKIFADPEGGESCCLISLTDFEPIAVNVEIQEGERKSDLLYNSCFYFTILELKQRLQIGVGFDIILDLPQLDLLSIHQDHTIVREHTAADFWSWLKAHSVEIGAKCPDSLVVSIQKLPNCLKDRIRHFRSLILAGGLPTNPIVIDDTSTDELAGQVISDQNNDELIDLDDGNDELQVNEPTLLTPLAIEAEYGGVDDGNDLFSEDDEVDELQKELGDTEKNTEDFSLVIPVYDEDFVQVPEDDDYLSSSHTTLQPLFQKLEENKSASSSSTTLAATLETTEQDDLLLPSSKREFIDSIDPDDAIGTPDAKKIRAA